MRKLHRPQSNPSSRQDAERYRFLREHGFQHWQSIAGTPDRVKLAFDAEGQSRAVLDAAIDAAIVKKERVR